jgi:hypothetical protein
MSIPKKNSRRVIVDDVEYRWRVRGRPTYDQALTTGRLILAVEQCEKRGSVLVVELAQSHPSNWMQEAASGVTPAVVTGHIRTALKLGWSPACKGPQFLMDDRKPVA